jgi:hypothetical protein
MDDYTHRLQKGGGGKESRGRRTTCSVVRTLLGPAAVALQHAHVREAPRVAWRFVCGPPAGARCCLPPHATASQARIVTLSTARCLLTPTILAVCDLAIFLGTCGPTVSPHGPKPPSRPQNRLGFSSHYFVDALFTLLEGVWKSYRDLVGPVVES